MIYYFNSLFVSLDGKISVSSQRRVCQIIVSIHPLRCFGPMDDRRVGRAQPSRVRIEHPGVIYNMDFQDPAAVQERYGRLLSSTFIPLGFAEIDRAARGIEVDSPTPIVQPIPSIGLMNLDDLVVVIDRDMGILPGIVPDPTVPGIPCNRIVAEGRISEASNTVMQIVIGGIVTLMYADDDPVVIDGNGGVKSAIPVNLIARQPDDGLLLAP